MNITYYLNKKGKHTAIYMSIRMPSSGRVQVKFPHFSAEPKDWSDGRFVTGKGRASHNQRQQELDRWKSDTLDFITKIFQKKQRPPKKTEIEKFLLFGKEADKIQLPNKKTHSEKVKLFLPELSLLIEEFINGKYLYNGKQLSDSSIDGYKQIYNVLDKFQKHHKINLSVKTIIEESTITKIEHFLIYVENLKLNTVGKRLKNLKTALNILLKRQVIDVNPFLKFGIKIPKEDVYSIALSIDEVRGLEGLDLSNNERLEQVRDHFVIMCYTGLRYSDYVKFVKSDKLYQIINVSNKKTGALSDVPIFPPVRKILQKYNGVLPTLISSQKMGAYVKEVCALIPSLQKMTYKIYTRNGRRVEEPCPRYMMVANHTSRRTFVTIMKRWGIEDSSIMAVTGHRDIRTLRVYDKMQKTEVVQKVMTDVSVHFTDYETAE